MLCACAPSDAPLLLPPRRPQSVHFTWIVESKDGSITEAMVRDCIDANKEKKESSVGGMIEGSGCKSTYDVRVGTARPATEKMSCTRKGG